MVLSPSASSHHQGRNSLIRIVADLFLVTHHAELLDTAHANSLRMCSGHPFQSSTTLWLCVRQADGSDVCVSMLMFVLLLLSFCVFVFCFVLFICLISRLLTCLLAALVCSYIHISIYVAVEIPLCACVPSRTITGSSRGDLALFCVMLACGFGLPSRLSGSRF